MSAFNLYIDIQRGALVTSPTNPAIASPPPFIEGDTPTWNIFLLAQTATYPIANPYTQILTAGITLEVALGQKIGTGGTIYTQQFTWTAVAAGANAPYWTATFPLNTAAIDTLIGSNATATAWLEVKMVQGGVPSTVLQSNITINAAVIQPGNLVVPPGQTALSLETAKSLFVPQKFTGQIILQDPVNGHSYALWVDPSGIFRTDKLT